MSSALRTIARGGKPNPPAMIRAKGIGGNLHVPNKAMRLLRAGVKTKSRWAQIIKQATSDRWNQQDRIRFKSLIISKRKYPMPKAMLIFEADQMLKTKGRVATHNVVISG